MIYFPHTPSGPLGKCVEQLFYLGNYQPEHKIERLVPDGCTNLVIELDGRTRYIYDNDSLKPIQTCQNAWFSGVHTGYFSFSTPETELFAVRFFAGGSHPVVKQALHHFHDKVVDATSIWGDEILALRHELIQLEEPMGKVKRVEAWLNTLLDESLMTPPVIQDAIHKLEQQANFSQIKEIIDASPYSPKHFIHLFKKYVGLSPKAFQRIRRFAEVFPAIMAEEKVNWAQLSADCGYYDQAHFIKDFKHFSGYNPTDFLDKDHDRQNFFPEEG